MMTIKKILKNSIPNRWKSMLVSRIDQRRHQRFLSQLQSNIITHYASKENATAEEKEVVHYLKANPVTVFPYDFQKKYDKSDIKVILDSSNGLHYVVHDGKKLYFKRSYTQAKIRSLYHGLLLDQDPDSPHLYLTQDFNLNANDVIADIGAAEGNFSLSTIESVKKIYLFECDPEWIEALEATFKPWKEKVEICNKFVSNSDDGHSISLDTFTKKNNDISFLKVDIEGEETHFLEGASAFLKTKDNLKMAICTYHKQEDETEFTALLKSNAFEVHPSKRFMIFYHDTNICAPYLRRGLLRAHKINTKNE